MWNIVDNEGTVVDGPFDDFDHANAEIDGIWADMEEDYEAGFVSEHPRDIGLRIVRVQCQTPMLD